MNLLDAMLALPKLQRHHEAIARKTPDGGVEVLDTPETGPCTDPACYECSETGCETCGKYPAACTCGAGIYLDPAKGVFFIKGIGGVCHRIQGALLIDTGEKPFLLPAEAVPVEWGVMHAVISLLRAEDGEPRTLEALPGPEDV